MLVFLELIALEMENFLINGIFATFCIFFHCILICLAIKLLFHIIKKCKLPIWLVSLSEESEIWLKLIEFASMMLDHIP